MHAGSSCVLCSQSFVYFILLFSVSLVSFLQYCFFGDLFRLPWLLNLLIFLFIWVLSVRFLYIIFPFFRSCIFSFLTHCCTSHPLLLFSVFPCFACFCISSLFLYLLSPVTFLYPFFCWILFLLSPLYLFSFLFICLHSHLYLFSFFSLVSLLLILDLLSSLASVPLLLFSVCSSVSSLHLLLPQSHFCTSFFFFCSNLSYSLVYVPHLIFPVPHHLYIFFSPSLDLFLHPISASSLYLFQYATHDTSGNNKFSIIPVLFLPEQLSDHKGGME